MPVKHPGRSALKLLALAGAVALTANARGQALPPLVVQSDRPSFSNGIQITPLGHVQVELGVTVAFSGGEKKLGLGELTARIPFASWGEVSLGIATYGRLVRGSGETEDAASGRNEGYMDPVVEFKIRLLDSASTDLGFIAGAALPGGSRNYREKHAQPNLTLALDQVLSETVALTVNVGGTFSSSGGNQFAVVLGGLSVSVATSDRVSLYGEAFFWSRSQPGGPSEQTLSAGVEYFLTKSVSLDARAGVGFGRTASEWFTGVGAAIAF